VPTLWELADEKSRESLKKLAQELGMENFNPEKPKRKIKATTRLESGDEIAILMSMTDSQIKERFENA